MSSTVKPIPDGYHRITPYLIVNGAAQAIEFYQRVFGATQTRRMAMPGGKACHAEIRVGDSAIMLADEFPKMGFRGPQSLGGSPVCLLVYVPQVDAVTEAAVAAGAKVLKPLRDEFYGDRTATVQDPFGHVWTIATHIEDVPQAELEQRAAVAMGQACK